MRIYYPKVILTNYKYPIINTPFIKYPSVNIFKIFKINFKNYLLVKKKYLWQEKNYTIFLVCKK